MRLETTILTYRPRFTLIGVRFCCLHNHEGRQVALCLSMSWHIRIVALTSLIRHKGTPYLSRWSFLHSDSEHNKSSFLSNHHCGEHPHSRWTRVLRPAQITQLGGVSSITELFIIQSPFLSRFQGLSFISLSYNNQVPLGARYRIQTDAYCLEGSRANR